MTKKICSKPMTLEMRAELMKLHDGEQNCDIYQKFNFSASNVRIHPGFLR
jgi:hypothetical protein